MTLDLSQRLTAAVRAHQSGDLETARAAYRAVLADLPNQPDALHYLGMIYYQEDDLDRALDHVGRAHDVKPSDPSIAANLGLVNQALGKLEDAEAMYKTSLDINPGQPEAWFNRGLARLQVHRYPEACFCFHKTLTLAPDHLQARRQLGIALMSSGKGKDAVAALRQCVAAQPGDPELRLELGRAYETCGDLAAAESEFRRATESDSGTAARAHVRLSVVLRRLGKVDEALTAAELAVAAESDDPDALRSLGHCKKSLGLLDDAANAYGRAHELLRDPSPERTINLPTFAMTTRSKLRHDAEQISWLVDHGIGQDRLPKIADACRDLAAEIDPGIADGQLVPLPAPKAGMDNAWYNRCLHLAESPRIDDGALEIDKAAVEENYRANEPGIVWIDDFLKPAALESLRRFCLESTVWYDCDHPNGYLGAYLQDGFASPLLQQIATEMADALPGIFGEHRLMQLWAYKYDSRLSGIDIHADFAAVNVNFWISPSEANEDSESGGMVIWDVEAPLEWTMDEYNTYDPVKQGTIRKFLKDAGAKRIVVPHRQNRCVVFNSNLLHKTDDIHFRDEYENRRINVTMLFGHREKSG